jgi:predicted nucleotidyltransferase
MMPLQNNETILKILTGYFSAKTEVLFCVLYGSFAKNKAKPTSDIDLAIYTLNILTAEEKIRIIEELSLVLKRPIDLVDLRNTHVPLSQEILTQGLIVKLSQKSVREKLITKMIYEVNDFLPLKRKVQKIKLGRFVKNE